MSISNCHLKPKLRRQRPRKTKIGTEVAHITRDSDTTFKVKKSKAIVQGRVYIAAASRTACYDPKTGFSVLLYWNRGVAEPRNFGLAHSVAWNKIL